MIVLMPISTSARGRRRTILFAPPSSTVTNSAEYFRKLRLSLWGRIKVRIHGSLRGNSRGRISAGKNWRVETSSSNKIENTIQVSGRN